jgi:hypothetical protein
VTGVGVRQRLLGKKYGYQVARRQAKVARWLYGTTIAAGRGPGPRVGPDLDLTLVAYSGERDATEQIASLRSFLRYVGRPASVTLGSDGTHRPATLDRIRRLHDDIEVVRPSEFVRDDLPDDVRAYAAAHPLGRKLAFMMSLRPTRPTLYADADVLFFPGAGALRNDIASADDGPRYLIDCLPPVDLRVVPEDLQTAPAVNSGFWLIRHPLAWDEPLRLLAELGGDYGFHTEQSLFHVAMHRAGGRPFDPARCVMQNDDRFKYRTRYENGSIVMRHYVSNIRHQFWLNLFRRHRAPATGTAPVAEAGVSSA